MATATKPNRATLQADLDEIETRLRAIGYHKGKILTETDRVLLDRKAQIEKQLNPFGAMADLETEECRKAGNPVCPYCGAVARKPRNKFLILHKKTCQAASNYDRATKTYQIEREMPGIEHGGWAF